MTRSPRSSDELKRSFGDTFAEDAQGGSQQILSASASSKMSAEPPSFNDLSAAKATAQRLTDVCNATAADIRSTGESVVKVANDIAAEAEALAELLSKHGASIASRIEDFTAMTRRVADQVQASRVEVLGASGTAQNVVSGSERAPEPSGNSPAR